MNNSKSWRRDIYVDGFPGIACLSVSYATHNIFPHKRFFIKGSIYSRIQQYDEIPRKHKKTNEELWYSGSLSDEHIKRIFPEIEPYFIWNGFSEVGPYYGRSYYYPSYFIGYSDKPNEELKQKRLEHARGKEHWPDATVEDLIDENKLKAHKQSLVKKMKWELKTLRFLEIKEDIQYFINSEEYGGMVRTNDTKTDYMRSCFTV